MGGGNISGPSYVVAMVTANEEVPCENKFVGNLASSSRTHGMER